jgi:hypothetical protein
MVLLVMALYREKSLSHWSLVTARRYDQWLMTNDSMTNHNTTPSSVNFNWLSPANTELA